MTPEETRAKWNEKYRNPKNKASGPDDFLVRHREELVKGRVMDLASGDGRNSLYLAKEGFKVTAVDISDVALEQLAKAAERAGADIKTERRDLELGDPNWSQGLTRYENIVVFNYKPAPDVVQELPALMPPDGTLLYCTFNLSHYNDAPGFRREFLLKSPELEDWPKELELRQFEDLGNRYGYVLRRS